jgi:signal transduction histidine kinase
MWSKIKRLAIPISIKLAILYATILSCILFLISVLTVVGLFYILYTQADDDINLSAASITRRLTDGEPLDRLSAPNILVPGVILRIFDEQNRLLIDSAPYLPGNRALAKNLAKDDDDAIYQKLTHLKINLRAARVDHNYFLYKKQAVWLDGRLYQFYIIKNMTEQTHFLKTLVKSLLVTNAFGLLIAVVSGIYISRRILRPIRDITDTAKEIEVTDLGKRIRETGGNDELHELARTFNHMLNRIQTGFEQQRRFVADASHELRTPITVISGYADMLDRWGKQDPAALEEGIGAIKSEAANMHALIEKLLFLAKADQGRQVLDKTAVAMEPLIAEIVHETRLIAPDHHIELINNDPATVHADAASLKEMLRIFIENSIKYTPAGGKISIESRQNNGQLVITVQDSGIGIPEEDQAKIFDRFYRVDKSRTKATGGTGLGLSIARWIAEQHDSTINLSSTYGDGTTVMVTIPFQGRIES